MFSSRKKIMLVDDNKPTLEMGKNILKQDYEVFPIPHPSILFKLLKEITPDLILLDVHMPDIDGYEVIKSLKSDDSFKDIPVIFLTSLKDEDSELYGLSLGAIDYVTKPFVAPLLLKRIENHLTTADQRVVLARQKEELKKFNSSLKDMVAEKTLEVISLQNTILHTVAELVEFRDDVTGGHISRTTKYLELMMNKLYQDATHKEILDWDIDLMLQSSLLHDVGKIAISDLILNKPARLTEEEFEVMKTHTSMGEVIIDRISKNGKHVDFLAQARIFAGTHHEKWDGSGYPHKLQGTDIPLQGRIMAIVDVLDALLSVRPYKKAFTFDEASKIIVDGRGNHFDPALVDTFMDIHQDLRAVTNSSE